MVTIRDIAKLTGYSITTISKAMNDYPDVAKKTKEKILKVCEEQNYVPNALGRNLSTKRTYTIGVVFSEETNQGITHPFFGELLNYLKIEVEKYGYDILLLGNTVGKRVKSYLSHCLQKSVDGVIILSAYPEEEGIKELVNSSIPKVCMQSYFPNENCFFSDNDKIMNDLVDYLVGEGHTDFGFVYGDQETYDGKHRLLGFKEGLSKYNLSISDDKVIPGVYYTIEEGRLAGQMFLKLSKLPTCIVCSSDTLAIGLSLEFMSKGIRIPEDVSITGYDNINLSTVLRPKLTTVMQDKETMAREASLCLIKEIESGLKHPKNHIIPAKIIKRESVKKLN